MRRLQNRGLEVRVTGSVPEQRFFVRRGDAEVSIGNMVGTSVFVFAHSRMSDKEQALADDILNQFDPLVPSSIPRRYIHSGMGWS